MSLCGYFRRVILTPVLSQSFSFSPVVFGSAPQVHRILCVAPDRERLKNLRLPIATEWLLQTWAYS